VRSIRALGIDVDVIFFDPRETRLHYALNLPSIVGAVRSGRYDLIHTHATYTMILVDIAKRWTRSTTPVVFTNHEPEILDTPRRTRTWHPSSHLRHSMHVKRYAASRADFVIFVSRDLAIRLAVRTPYEVIPCGVDLDKFRLIDKTECRRQIGLPLGKPVIFFPPNAGNRRKRFELARRAYEHVQQQIPDALLVTGGGIDADAMPMYYNAANVMLQTSFIEASPTVVKEALACEVPVVSTDAGDTKEVIRGVPYCWVCPEDARELANRILEANGNRAVGAREHLRRIGLGLDQVARRVVGVYEQILSR